MGNAAGQFKQPYSDNIHRALTTAHLRANLSQELSQVYSNGDPEAYPISAYSYIMAPCQQGRDTCKGAYQDAGQTETMARFLDHVACQGQVNMAAIGYSPLPPNLSQEMAKSVARLTNQPEKQLTKDNCANPTFTGDYSGGHQAPPNPADQVAKNKGNDDTGPNDKDKADAGQNAGQANASDDNLANGGSKNGRNAEPAAYVGGGFGGFGALAALVLFVAIDHPRGGAQDPSQLSSCGQRGQRGSQEPARA